MITRIFFFIFCIQSFFLSYGQNQLFKELKKRKNSKSNELQLYPTEEVSGEIHKKYMGKIVFSDKSIPRGKETETEFKNSFLFGNYIYVRVYLENSLANATLKEFNAQSRDELNTNNLEFYYSFQLNNNPSPDTVFRAFDNSEPQERTEALILEEELVEDPLGQTTATKYFTNFLTHIENQLTPGIHEITVNLHGLLVGKPHKKTKPLATGKFLLQVNEMSKTLLKETNVCMFKSKTGMIEKSVEDMIRKAYEPTLGDVVKRISINSREWTPERHPDSGALIGRRIYATIFTYNSSSKECAAVTYGCFQSFDGRDYANYVDVDTSYTGGNVPCLCTEE